MIITETVKILISYKNIEYYKLHFGNIKLGDKLEINPNSLLPGSHKIILAKCDICGFEKNIPYRDYLSSLNNGNCFTCNKCKNDKVKKTKLEKYGNENYYNIDKSKKTNLDKYGCENVFQNDDIKNKIKINNLEKYGVEFTSQVEKFKNKSKDKISKRTVEDNDKINKKRSETNLEKYGVEYISQHAIIKNKISNNIKKHYILNANYFYEDLININGDLLKIKCSKCHNIFDITKQLYQSRKFFKTEICTICNSVNSTDSFSENEMKNYILDKYDGNVLLNDRKIINGELDIYLPDFKMAFEFNGLYWHSELYKSNNYHLNKTEECEKLGIHLIHIYEDDWIYKQDIVKSRILNLLGKSNKIFARKCTINEISDNKIVREFLEQNHLQGFVGSKIKLGLFYNGELVSLMTFGSYRKSMGQKGLDGHYEMLRFCNKLNTNVIGGASKLFKYFTEKYNPIEIISYADRSWSQGNLYEKLGFNLSHKTRPNYYYFKNKKRLNRFNFRKDILIKEGYDSNKTEHEIMLERKIYRIYDSGNFKFIWPS